MQRPRDTNEAEGAVTGADEAHPEGDPGSASDRTSGQRAHHGKDAAGEWQTVATGLRGTQAALPSMRCPKGCRFKVHAEGITGWSVYSEASAAVATTQEPPMPQGAVRLEVAARLGRPPLLQISLQPSTMPLAFRPADAACTHMPSLLPRSGQ